MGSAATRRRAKGHEGKHATGANIAGFTRATGTKFAQGIV